MADRYPYGHGVPGEERSTTCSPAHRAGETVDHRGLPAAGAATPAGAELSRGLQAAAEHGAGGVGAMGGDLHLGAPVGDPDRDQEADRAARSERHVRDAAEPLGRPQHQFGGGVVSGRGQVPDPRSLGGARAVGQREGDPDDPGAVLLEDGNGHEHVTQVGPGRGQTPALSDVGPRPERDADRLRCDGGGRQRGHRRR